MRSENELRAELATLLDAPTERNRSKIMSLVWTLNSGWTWDMAQEVSAKLMQAARRQRGPGLPALQVGDDAADEAAERTPLQARPPT